jgi:single-stranded-DNA-specific exonuclease
MDRDWPAERSALQAAQRFLADASGRVVVACHNDVDGLASAVIVARALRARSVEASIVPSRRGEHVHTRSMQERIESLRPEHLVVTDMGMRPGRISDVPTLVIDHHSPSSGVPQDALILNGHDREPVAPASVLALAACQAFEGADQSGWLAALGALADTGNAAAFASITGVDARGTAWSRAVSLLNAGRRSAEDDAATPLAVLERAAGVREIMDGTVAGVEVLESYRRAVHAEVERCSRVAPQRIGGAALIRFSSGAQVHPLVATRWAKRLAPAVVIAANEGFLAGRVNFAARCAADTDLLQWLRRLPFTPSPEAEYANGHPRATGGSLPLRDFDRFLEALRDGQEPAVRRGDRDRVDG